MADARKCANTSISDFVKDKIGSPPWPNWAGLIPGDTQNGWNASKAAWRSQCDSIMDDFERCVGVKIDRRSGDIDVLRMETLATLRDYLVELAELASAEVAVRVAQTNLRMARRTLRSFG